MHNYANLILWIYIILLLVGGLIGFLKANSKVSLVTSAAFAAALVLTAVPGVFQPGFALGMTNVILALLLIVFAVRYTKTKKFMPSGMMLILTIATLALRNIHF